jgi:hypothetical protein
MNDDPLHFGVQTKQLSRLIIWPDLSVTLTTPKPNRWIRFWHWALLGWRWEDVE